MPALWCFSLANARHHLVHSNLLLQRCAFMPWSNTVLFGPFEISVVFANARRHLVHVNLLLRCCAYHGLAEHFIVLTVCSKWLVILPCVVDKDILSQMVSSSALYS